MWTPIGSRFSIPQMAIVVSEASRRTSNSISYQPSRLRSTRTWPIGLAASPAAMRARASSSVVAKPPPPPPSVNAGRTTIGALSISTKRSPSSTDSTTADSGHGLADPRHQRAEAAAVLGGPDGVEGRAEHPHPAAVEHPGVVERDGKVQPGLSAERREQGVRVDAPRSPA